MAKPRGVLKYPVDALPITLVVATLALSILPFCVTMPVWALVGVWIAVLYLRTFAPFIQHNHAHLPVFNARPLNLLYDVLLAQNTGYATALWELHHNRGHHRNFLDPDKDVATVNYPGTTTAMPRWYYAVRGNLTIHRDAIRIGFDERRANRKSLLGKLSFELVVQLALTTIGFAISPWLTLGFFIVPNALSALLVWWQSYPHHHELATDSVYAASITDDHGFTNLMTFNIGHHTAHHEKPTLHWSLLPLRTARILHLIDPRCIRTRRDTKIPLRLIRD
jgi:fatty acid desaturase